MKNVNSSINSDLHSPFSLREVKSFNLSTNTLQCFVYHCQRGNGPLEYHKSDAIELQTQKKKW